MNLRNFVFLAAALMSAACGSPPDPYNAQSDCPKQPNCGQCASRGGCGFCDGQCLAVGAPACTSGKWAKSPDQCPVPGATPATPAR